MLNLMIELTKEAAARIKTMHDELDDPNRHMRVFIEPGGCSGFEYGMSFDLPKENDQQVESEGVTILLDPDSSLYLKGCRIHFDDGLHGKGFEIINPNAKSTCGCGKSFN